MSWERTAHSLSLAGWCRNKGLLCLAFACALALFREQRSPRSPRSAGAPLLRYSLIVVLYSVLVPQMSVCHSVYQKHAVQPHDQELSKRLEG